MCRVGAGLIKLADAEIVSTYVVIDVIRLFSTLHYTTIHICSTQHYSTILVDLPHPPIEEMVCSMVMDGDGLACLVYHLKSHLAAAT